MHFIFFTVGNPFSQEKKKLRENADDFVDLTAVKAAAWAWYERGAGSENKPPPVFDITRTQKSLGPSRYKLEAITMAEKDLKAKEEEKQTRNGFRSLLDSYEIESISKNFGSLVQPGRTSFGDEFLSVESFRWSGESFRWSSVSPASENGDLLRKKKQKKKQQNQKEKMGGIWLKNAPVCGVGKNMVADKAIISYRRPEKHSPVVRVGK